MVLLNCSWISLRVHTCYDCKETLEWFLWNVPSSRNDYPINWIFIHWSIWTNCLSHNTHYRQFRYLGWPHMRSDGYCQQDCFYHDLLCSHKFMGVLSPLSYVYRSVLGSWLRLKTIQWLNLVRSILFKEHKSLTFI